MRTIFKYPLPTQIIGIGRYNLLLPLYAKPLTVVNQDEKVTLYMEVESENSGFHMPVWVEGTGRPMPTFSAAGDILTAEVRYLGTVQMADGFVWHVYVPTEHWIVEASNAQTHR